MKMRARDGNLYVEVTLRDVFERCDVSDSPILAEIKRIYNENTRLRDSLDESEHSESMAWDRVRKAEADNAKLRGLVEKMHVDMREMLYIIGKNPDTHGYCRYYGDCLGAAEGIMRKLGVEAP